MGAVLLDALHHAASPNVQQESLIHHRFFAWGERQWLRSRFTPRSNLVAQPVGSPLLSPCSPSALDHVFIRHRTRLRGAVVPLAGSWREGDADSRQQESAGAQPDGHLVVVQPVIEPAASGPRPAHTATGIPCTAEL